MVVGNRGMAGHDRASGNLAVYLFETRCDADCGCHLLFCRSILVDHDLCGLEHAVVLGLGRERGRNRSFDAIPAATGGDRGRGVWMCDNPSPDFSPRGRTCREISSAQ